MILRAGPYSCAEWEFGGVPAWLLAEPKMETALRSNDPAFMAPAERWIIKLGQEVAPFQIGRGGPIIAVQMENEYGDFGSDQEYLKHMREIFLKAGFTDALLFTTNPTRGEKNGSLPGTYAAVNFGIGHAKQGLDFLAQMRPGEPLFAAEYWPGWFDHWGQPHQTRPIEPQIADLENILSRGASLNLYMFHGGTSFGFMSGASWTNNQYMPDVTSYDYDAPLDEAGHPRRSTTRIATCSRSMQAIPCRRFRNQRPSSQSHLLLWMKARRSGTTCLRPSTQNLPGRWRHTARPTVSSSTARSCIAPRTRRWRFHGSMTTQGFI